MTIEELAIIVAKGFENTATKQDIADLRLEIGGVESRLNKKIERLDLKVDDIADAIRQLDEVDIHDLQRRVMVLEKKFRSNKVQL